MDVSPKTRAVTNRLAQKTVDMAISMIELEAFTPFSYSIDSSGSLKITDFSFIPPEQQHDTVRAQLKEEAALDKNEALAMGYDAFSTNLETGEKSDAIIIEVEHRDGVSITLTYNYFSALGEVVVESPITQLKEPAFFV